MSPPDEPHRERAEVTGSGGWAGQTARTIAAFTDVEHSTANDPLDRAAKAELVRR